VEYQDLNGKMRRIRKADGLLGWAIQHEVDHLNGILFTERIRDLSTLRDLSKEQEEGAAPTAAEQVAQTADQSAATDTPKVQA
jgi:SH3-like domain-containing protein